MATASSLERMLTDVEVLDALQIDESVLRRLVSRKELPAYNIGGLLRFKRADVETFLEQQRIGDEDAGGRELAERHELRLQFWSLLLERARGRTPLHARVSPGIDNWLSTGAGRSGLNYVYYIRNDRGQVALAIDRGKGQDTANKAIFDELHTRKDEIEATFGTPLEWDRGPDERRSSFIRNNLTQGGLRMQDHWEPLADAMIDAMVRLEGALRVPLAELRIPS